MERRGFLQGAAAIGAARMIPGWMGWGEEPVAVHTVLLVTKCHLDVGFTETQAKVMRRYFDVYYPAAIKVAAGLREAGGDRYTWTTGSWLLYEYLEQATAAQRRSMEEAIVAGDITWHALPFSWQTEMLDRSMVRGGLGFSRELDRRFGRKTIGAKMTDVPGHSRGIVGPLHEAGVRLLDIGINAASTPPEVPELFLWEDAGGASLAMMYHRADYGGVVEVPGTGVAVDVEVRNDNNGPHTPEEIAAIYAKLRARYPGTAVRASNLNEVAAAVDRVRDRLPVVTAEIGDTWIYGCASDPGKVARFREMMRLRKEWIGRKTFAVGDATDRAMLRRLLLAAEHTWGTDTKAYVDYTHYRPGDLRAVLGTGGYAVMEESWREKRDDVAEGVAGLPGSLRDEATARLERLHVARPTVEGMATHDVTAPVEGRHFTVRFDPGTGAIVGLRHRASGREFASMGHPLGLFTYQTLSGADYVAYRKQYVKSEEDWAPRDFGKPGVERFGAEAREWHPKVVGCWAAGERVVLELAIDDAAAMASGNVAWPERIFVELLPPVNAARLEMRVVTLGKSASRMPEAMWLTFAPASPGTWSVEKVDEAVNPLDVVRGGGRSMHAVSGAVRGGGLAIHSLDAPVVAMGERSPLNFTLEQPNLSKGVHFALFNNAWGTNYPQWASGDWAFRFTLTV